MSLMRLACFSKLGCGELLVNSIDRDGTMIGYDKEIVEKY